MPDKTIRLVIDLTYDTEVMRGDCEDAIKWFNGVRSVCDPDQVPTVKHN